MAPLSNINSSFGGPAEDRVSSQIRFNWGNPSDIISLLMLVGGEVIQRALAQQTGGASPLPPPVVFSFGWVTYTFCGLLAAVGNKLFLPPPELPSVVFDTEWGYQRNNQSWIINRLLRDFEEYWMPKEVRKSFGAMLAEAGNRKVGRTGLCISVFEASSKVQAGVPVRDFCWYSGYLVAILQLVIAVIPWIVWNVWEIFVITIAGTFVAFLTASMPHWTRERWACQRNTKKTHVITRGNGAQHAIVIIGAGNGLDFESLATSSEGLPKTSTTTWLFSILTILWCVLLITVSGLKEKTWFLFAVGTVGTLHTIYIAGAPRQPALYGIHLEYRDVFVRPKVMATLMDAERKYPGLGRSMVKTFFPGDLHEHEKVWWSEAREREDYRKSQAKVQNKPTPSGTATAVSSSVPSTKLSDVASEAAKEGAAE